MKDFKPFPTFIFLADDDVADRLLFKDAIGQIDPCISLKMAEDGRELLVYLRDPRNPLPSLVFLDLNMPHFNGLMCLEEIRKNERLKSVPVIIYSTSAQPDSILKCLDAGANLYFAKPATFQDLIDRLRMTLVMKWDELAPSKDNFVLSNEVGL